MLKTDRLVLLLAIIMASFSLYSLSVNVLAIPVGSTTHFVTPDGLCNGPTPCYDSIQDAVNASVAGDEILVASGIYSDIQALPYFNQTITQVIFISHSLSLRGGYSSSDWSVANPSQNVTILDGSGEHRVMFAHGLSENEETQLTVTGFEIRHGYAVTESVSGSGGGILLRDITGTIESNVIHHNIATGGGGGIAALLGTFTITNNILHDNQSGSSHAFGGGGGIEVTNVGLLTNPIYIGGNTIYDNVTAGVGGGVGFADCQNATLENNDIHHNEALMGGGFGIYTCINIDILYNRLSFNESEEGGAGIYITVFENRFIGNLVRGNVVHPASITTGFIEGRGGGLTLGGIQLNGEPGPAGEFNNNIFIENDAAAEGDAIYFQFGHIEGQHNTFHNNGDEAAITIWGPTTSGTSCFTSLVPCTQMVLTNTIVSSQTTAVDILGRAAGIDMVGVLWHQVANTLTLPLDASAVFSSFSEVRWGDPMFALDGFHIMTGSAAIDAGIATGLMTDYDGEMRPAGPFPDLGADEFGILTRPYQLFLPIVGN